MQPLPDSLDEALETAKVEPRDRATVDLARTYAALIADATVKAVYEEPLRVLAEVVAQAESPEAVRAFRKVSTALAAHSVASDLGPKLLAALLALGMAPSSRGVVKGTTGDEQPNPLDELRERRRTRSHRAAAVDPAAP